MPSRTLRPRPAASRSATTDSALDASSTSTSAHHSPFDSPTASSSSTSLSSLASDDASPKGRPALDAYGNEFQIPDFTIKQIRDAIPPHCFERSGLRGLSYVARDLACLASVFYLFHNYVTPETVPSAPARAALWGVYAFVQGLFATGIWVLAHECGHQSFSTSKTLNDTVGWILHSSLLVPYFSWKISHGKHHKSTGHMERDMVFVPRTRDLYASYIGKLSYQLSEVAEETPLATVIHSIGQQLIGWPLYIMTNTTGHNHHENQAEGKGKGKKNGFFRGVNHFNPASPLYERKDEHLIILSDIGLAIMGTVLYLAVQKFGLANVLVWYGLPYLWVNHWLGKFSSLGRSTSTDHEQSASRSSSTRTPRCRTTSRRPGRTRAARPRPSTASSASSGGSSSTASSRRTCCTTT
jgi:omega-6 fatty acid desaturase (delta-12 desaturase)